MEEKVIKNSRKSLVSYLGVIISFLIMVIGVSYAYFGVYVQEQNTSSMLFGTGVVDLSLEGSTINITSLAPIYADNKDTMATSYDFTVNNPSGKLNSCYSLDILIESIAPELSNQFLKWELINNTDSTTTNGTFNNSSDGGTISIEQNKILNQNQTKNYTFRIWMQYDAEAEQANMLGKSLNISIKSTAYNGSCITEGTAVVYETSGMHEYTVSTTGYYEVELWGAQGGTNNSTYYSGKGGYSTGIVFLEAREKLFFYIGGSGLLAASGYNGGGNGAGIGYGGGGSSDVRLISSQNNSLISLTSRIMVASGGGAGGYLNSDNGGNGGNGGGLIGDYGHEIIVNDYYLGLRYSDLGGKQSSGGNISNPDREGQINGSFGNGGTWEYDSYGISGGGGGYYGGGAAVNSSSASGGSSYISGYAGVNSVNRDTTITHNNGTLHYSGKYFINPKMEAGVQNGDGKASIKYLGFKPKRVNTKLNGVRYIKDCINGRTLSSGFDNTNTWLEIQAIHNGQNVAHGKSDGIKYTSTAIASEPYSNLVDGIMDDSSFESKSTSANSGLQCVIVDLGQPYDLDEIAVWHWHFDYAKYEDNVTYVTNNDLSSWTAETDSIYNWIEVINNEDVETSEGKRVSAYEN